MFTNNDVVAFIIVPLIGNLFLIYVFFEFMGKVERNTYKHKFAYIISYIAFSIIASSIPLLGVPILSGMSIIVGNMLIGHYLYNNTKLYLLYYFIYSICLLFCDLLINIVNPILVTELGIYFSSTQSYLMFSVLTLRLLEYIYSKLFTLLINKRSAVNVTAKQCIRTLIVPIFSIVYIFTLIMYLQIYIGLEEMSLFMVNVILILILNVYMTYIIDSISKNNILQNEINLYHQQTKLQYQYYDNLEMKYQESRKLIHDIRNHLHTIEDLYNMNDLQAGTKYTQDIHQMLNELNQKYYTSNKVLNIILNDKFQKIKNTHIDLDYRIGNIDLGFIRDIDITTVFANLLDNAIDAAMVVKNNSYIKIDVDKFNEFIVINIENSTNDIPVKKGERFKSTKKNHQGLGLDNTIRAIKGYGGTMVVDYCENKFKVNIVIPT
ncbi:GHKL domain-containing protein [Paraclostridium sordellii]|uniref:sensor histidine kinase n=1 Tax=Paraclostridium sordellii TaxID=1505 RepID=UPI0005DEEBDD|nr:GHKL domain-containing protein [Paeniclostridium sordellii]CEP80392.1 sensor histidine kinase VirS [[Clostridium] sordellii] [Paeniclostridium sordellii]